MNVWVDLAFKLGALIIAYAFLYVVKPAVNSWVTKNVREDVQKIVIDAVQAAEQTIVKNKDKKEYVENVVNAQLEKLGVQGLDTDYLDSVIESTVYAVKAENYNTLGDKG